MVVRAAAVLVIGLGLVTPVSVGAQFRLSNISIGDVERVVRIGSLIYDIARESGCASGSSAGRSSRLGARVVMTGEEFVGVNYKWGGNTPAEGFDCSGFVKYVYARHDVTLPRTSRTQSQVGEWLPARVTALRQGDLMFFANSGGRINHVAIYAGANRIIHSSSSGSGVRYDDLGSTRGRWFANHMVAARRVADDGGSLVDALLASRLAFDFFDPPDLAPGVR